MGIVLTGAEVRPGQALKPEQSRSGQADTQVSDHLLRPEAHPVS